MSGRDTAPTQGTVPDAGLGYVLDLADSGLSWALRPCGLEKFAEMHYVEGPNLH